jgi:lipid-binding SYLF domain-containing protein
MAWMGYVSDVHLLLTRKHLRPLQVIPRQVLENAKGFAIYSVVKAGFVLSARAGSGIVIARLPDGEDPDPE